MGRLINSILPIAGLALVASPALADTGRAGGAMRISAHVPEFCQITPLELFATAGDGRVSGSVLETCNSQRGYSVVATHRNLDDGETVAFTYAGTTSLLRSHGWSPVAYRAGARYGYRPLRVRYASLNRPLAINLTITAY
ncbi:hypothetical protein [Pseudopontixanthobacter vadosimaris]|uniref:hypothetical protein n=1 Tax=Pseudopontixanthobacter vadosimaris TaxID=2726450 RepID=UPI0014746823|nr:hypothetical protein [Pseudopontixanthobacter vadosimaris]